MADNFTVCGRLTVNRNTIVDIRIRKQIRLKKKRM